MTSTWLVVINLVSSALTIALFVWRRWSPFSRDYMQRRQWGVFMWSALMALGVVAPMQLLTETLGLTMPKQTEQLLVQILSNDWGFLALAVAVPLAEEMVFRGAVLRVLLRHFGTRRYWWPIVLSAVLFGAAHGNGPNIGCRSEMAHDGYIHQGKQRHSDVAHHRRKGKA